MIVLVGGEKGGTGKTTLATNIAVKLALEGKEVLLIDADRQGSASAWSATREDKHYKPRITCIQKLGNNIARQIKDLHEKYPYIVIDAGGRDSVELRATLIVADILVTPIQASQPDVWTLSKVEGWVKEAKLFNEKLIAKVVINCGSTNHKVNETEEAQSIINDFEELKLSDIVISHRVAFRKAARGLSVFELENKDNKAIAEIENIYKEIFG